MSHVFKNIVWLHSFMGMRMIFETAGFSDKYKFHRPEGIKRWRQDINSKKFLTENPSKLSLYG